MLSIIVAKAKNNIIGKDNKMIWHLPEDLKHFKELTTGHAIIMGRKTFESLGKVLPDRKHIVFTQNPDFKVNDNNVEIVHSLLQIQDLIEGEEEAFIIGGAMIYNFLMPYVKKMYVTEIKEEFEGDAFFPKISENTWKETSREKGIKDEENPLDYEFVIPREDNKQGYILSPSAAYKIIGNAVPPLLAYHIGKRIENLWNLYFGPDEVII